MKVNGELCYPRGHIHTTMPGLGRYGYTEWVEQEEFFSVENSGVRPVSLVTTSLSLGQGMLHRDLSEKPGCQLLGGDCNKRMAIQPTG